MQISRLKLVLGQFLSWWFLWKLGILKDVKLMYVSYGHLVILCHSLVLIEYAMIFTVLCASFSLLSKVVKKKKNFMLRYI